MTVAVRAVLLAALVLSACDDAVDTEVIVTIRAQPAVADELDKVEVEVQGTSENAPSATPEAVSLPYVIKLQPLGGDARRQYEVTANAYDSDGTLIAQARLSSGFVRGERVFVVMELEDACRGVAACDDGKTCHAPRGAAPPGRCVSAAVDADDFGSSEGDAPRLGELIDGRGDVPEGPDGGAGRDGMAGGAPGAGEGAGSGAAGSGAGGAAGSAGRSGAGGSGEAGATAGSGTTCEIDPMSCDAVLETLVVTAEGADVPLDPPFDPDRKRYALRPPLAAKNLDIMATAAAPIAIAIEGATMTSPSTFRVERPAAGASELTVAVSSPTETADYVLTLRRGVQEAFLKAADSSVEGLLGTSVAAVANTVVVGMPGTGNAPGVAYRYERDAGQWRVDETPLSGGNGGDEFGYSVAIAGSTIAVGAPRTDSARGVVYAFENGASATLIPETRVDSHRFGEAVAIDADTIAASAPNAGSVTVFLRGNSTWTVQDTLTEDDDNGEPRFGASLALTAQGDVLAVGDPGQDDDGANSGAVFVYRRSGSTWALQQMLKSDPPRARQQFGHAVALQGGMLAVGTHDQDLTSTSGAVYVFREQGNDWRPHSTLRPRVEVLGIRFGDSVALADGLLVIGAPLESSKGMGVSAAATSAQPSDHAGAGAAYLFLDTPQGFVEDAFIKPSNPGSGDGFGTTVAIAAGLIVVGAPAEDSEEVGVGMGTAGNNDVMDSGAAYLFR